MSWPSLQPYGIRHVNSQREPDNPLLTRRRAIAVMVAVPAGWSLLGAASPARATPDEMQKAVRDFVGSAEIKRGRIKLDLPPLVENGNVVPMTVSVESPMSAADFVKRIAVFNEKNPQPNIATFHLGPKSGKASVSTRVRLADTQTITAIAEMSDGSFWSQTADVIVTLAACTEGS